MKGIMRNNIFKKFLIVLILIVMTSNFIMPNYVYAEGEGGKLFTPITELLVGIADRVLATMQDIFVGEGDWTNLATGDSIETVAPDEFGFTGGFLSIDGTVSKYSVRYSPGVIFSGNVPALDINFIEPMTDTTFEQPIMRYEREIENISWADVKEHYGAPEDLQIQKAGFWVSLFLPSNDNYYAFWTHNGEQYYFVCNDLDPSVLFGGRWIHDLIESLGGEDRLEGTLFKYQDSGETTSVTKESSAAVLQNQISKWYIALRTFALVGLLSVLVYVGIRIILSSGSPQNQAKYKSMLKDWLVAICILFLLHYIMAFILNITGQIRDVFEASAIDPGNEDPFMSNIRNKISGEGSYWVYFGYVVMYIALVIMTVTFTIEYVKRVVFIAFLTMIAPLIALTYPLDKIKDGQAQAFSMWLREYIFNCLLQPVHLLLYTMFISSSMDFMNTNPIFAIITLAFFKPAEKFFRKMFGFDKSESVSTMGAMAGGAMVMNMLNKVKGVGPKGNKDSNGSGGDKSGGSAPVRTATRNGGTGGPIAPTSPTAPIPPTPPTSGGPGGATGGPASGSGGAAGGPASGSGEATGGPASGSGGATGGLASGSGGATGGPSSGYASSGYSVSNGMRALRKRYLNGPNLLKSAGKWTGRALGAVAGGTIGLAADIADGDIGKYTLGGAVVGSHLTENIPENVVHDIKEGAETYKKGAMGEEAYNNEQFDKQFYKSDGYKKILSSSALSSHYSEAAIKQHTQTFLDNGITDAGTIQKALEAGVIDGDEYKAVTDVGITDMKKYSLVKKEIKTKLGTDKVKELGASGIAARMAIAQNMPTGLYKDKDSFVKYARRYGIRDEDAAEELFDEIKYFT